MSCFMAQICHASGVQIWTMDYGPWNMDHPWTMDNGLWIMDHGPCTMDHGLWTMAYGPVNPGSTIGNSIAIGNTIGNSPRAIGNTISKTIHKLWF